MSLTPCKMAEYFLVQVSPIFQKVWITALHFEGRLVSVPVLTNQKRISVFMKQKAKREFSSVCFAESHCRGSAPGAERAAPPSSFLGSYTQHPSAKQP